MREKTYSKDPTHIKRTVNSLWGFVQAITGRELQSHTDIFKDANTRYRKEKDEEIIIEI